VVSRRVGPESAGGTTELAPTRAKPRGLERLGAAMVRHRRAVVAIWVVALVLLGVGATAQHSVLRDVFSVPGTNSQAATNVLDQRFPAQQQPQATIVIAAAPGQTVTGAETQAAVGSMLTAIGKQPGVASVKNPFTPPERVSRNGRIAIATVSYEGTYSDLPVDAFADLTAAARPLEATGVQVEFGGQVTDIQNAGSNDYADLIGIVAGLLILFFLFRSLLAAFLPIGTAIFGVVIAGSVLLLIASQVTIGTVAPILGSMIGLGVGIDYSLLVLSRYLQNRDEGMEHEAGVAHAIGTAGASSLFAGCCVAIALCGLALAGIPYVAMLGYSAGLFVAVMVLAALTLLPAVLAITGKRITRKHKNVEAAEEVGGMWYRFAHVVSRHAVLCVVASLIVLAILAAPILDLELGFTDDGNAPTSQTQRKAYDLTTEGFGEGANGPLIVAVSLPTVTGSDAATLITDVETLAGALGKAPGVASVTPPIPSPQKNAAVVLVTPDQAPNAEATQQLVRDLRSSVVPDATKGTALAGHVFVGGATAALIDVTDRISERLLWCIAAVVIAAFLLLMVVFRSILVPLKAAIMNLLSIGAAYGVIVAVFQWGWGRSLIGLNEAVPIVAFVPLMMFAILFGLSMDYEVFLLSRIREEFLRTGDSRESVATGVAKTARVITAAAAIMISVFLGFVFTPQPTVKMMGIGMAAAVFVDATIVRLLLVPATMELLGAANWWLPKWLDRVLPHLDLEGSAVPAPAESGATHLQVTGVASAPSVAASGADDAELAAASEVPS
jgi:RND superfamily putative drug exporter